MRAFGQITIVDLVDDLVWKGSFDAAPKNPEQGWAYYNTKEGKSYIYNSEQGIWEVFSQNGLGIKRTVRYYNLGTATPAVPTTNPPSAEWSTTEPPYDKTKNLYTVDLVIYANDTYIYSDVSLSSSYTAAKDVQDSIDNLSIGGRNLLFKSGVSVTTNEEKVNQYQTTIVLDPEQEATFSMSVTPAKEIEKFVVCTSQGKYCLAEFPITNFDPQILKKTFNINYAKNYTPTEDPRNSDIVIYRLPKDIPFSEKKYLVSHETAEGIKLKVTQDLAVMQSGSGTPSYENPRDFTPWSGANMVKSGKNLLGLRGKQHVASYYGIKTKINADDSIRYYGWTSINNPTFCTIKLRGLNPNAKEDIQLKYTQQDSQTPVKAWIEEIRKELYIVVQFQAVTNSNIDATVRFEVVPKARASEEVYEPYNGRTYSIDFRDSIYGGEINWTAGFIKTYGHIFLDGTESWKKESRKGKKVFILDSLAEITKSNEIGRVWCNKYPTLSEKEAELKDKNIYLDTTGKIVVSDSTFSEVSEFKSSLQEQNRLKQPLEIVYAKKDFNDGMMHFPPLEIAASEKKSVFYADTSKIQVSGYSFYISEKSTIHWAKLEKGNQATDWTPAPEEVQEEIDKTKVAIKSVDVEYAINDSSVKAPTSDWSSEPPQWQNGKYIWSRTTTTLLNDTFFTSDPVCITGAKGDTGGSGAPGRGIKKITEQYYLSSSKVEQKDGNWIDNEPPLWKKNFYFWTRSKIEYTNPDGVEYTEAICDLNWENVQQELDKNKTEIENAHNDIVANSYDIISNQEEILKFKPRTIEDKKTIDLSPEILTFEVVQTTKEGKKRIKDYNYSIKIDEVDVKKYTSFDMTKETVNLDLAYFIKTAFSESQTQEKWLQEGLLKNSTNIVTFQFLQDEKIPRQKSIFCRFGIDQEGAALNVNATGINAAIQNTKLDFNSDGLKVKNGGFKILNNSNEEVLKADTKGNLVLIGTVYANEGKFSGDITGASGRFSGDITGATGDFKGNISATTGTIGGFTIKEGTLVSEKKTAQGIPLITLNGKDGQIIADNIQLGTGATIKDYIKIGQTVKLQKPAVEGGAFLTVEHQGTPCLIFGSNGLITIGKKGQTAETSNLININGTAGTISSSNFVDDGFGWKISSKESIFNDVTIRGSIKACVLEYGSVQAVGGMLLVRPSSIVKEAIKTSIETKPGVSKEAVRLKLENTDGFEVEDYCGIEQGSGITVVRQYYQIGKKEGKYIYIFGANANNLEGKPIISFGKKGSVGIGINASTQDFFTPPQAISVFDFDNNRDPKVIPHIILGKLPNDDTYGYAKNTYGLYAENVLLRGSLVTQSQIDKDNPTYSGISTIYRGSEAPTSHLYEGYFKDEAGNSTVSEILLWAGAAGTGKSAIEQSKFFVDRNGNLFAGSGYFKGTIITDAKITASELQTAVITGSVKQEGKAALTIKNTNNGEGILFTNDKADTEKNPIRETIFKVSDKKLEANVDEVIFNQNFRVNENGSMLLDKFFITDPKKVVSIAESIAETQALKFSGSQISFLKNFREKEQTGTIDSYISFGDGISFSTDGAKTESLKIGVNQFRCNMDMLFTKSVRYGEKMEYKPVYGKKEGSQLNELIGYDLFID